MKKLLAIDMDGTCLTDKKKITDKTLNALKEAARNGIAVVPTTGRSLDSLPRQLLKEDFFRYAITSNGARVYDAKEGKTLFASLVPKQEALSLLSEAKNKKLGLTAHVENQNIVEGFWLNLKGRLIYKKDTENSIKTKNILQTVENLSGDAEEIQFFFFNAKQKEAARNIVARHPDYASSFGRIYVEIYRKDVSKGAAIKKLAEWLGIEKRDVACVGNAENDLTMFDASNLKIAVGNADEDLKNKADLIVATNNDDGVAEAVEKILAGR